VVPSTRRKGGLMSDKNNTDSSVVELKGKTYSVSKLGSQVDIFAATTRAIGEFVGREFGHEMRMLVLYGKGATFAAPTLDANATKQDEMKWSKDYDVFIKKKTKYDDEKAKVFAIILSRCDEPMKNKVEGHQKYAQMEQDCDVAALLEVIKESAFDSHERQYSARQAASAWKQLAYCHQQEDETIVQFYQRFTETVDRTERMYGTIVPSVMVDGDKSSAKIDDKRKKAREKMIVILFMDGANKGFKPLMRDLENDYVLGTNKYPATLAEALQVLMVYSEQPVYKAIMKKLKKRQSVETEEGSPDISFVQMKKIDMIKKGLCFRCGEKGHKASECEKKKESEETAEGTMHMQQQQFSWMA
jgi:Zinc knuckle